MFVTAACGVMLVFGFGLKAQCMGPWGGREYRQLCYNDIQPLYGLREIDAGVFPYIHGRLTADDALVGGAIEYPVLTGAFMWFAGRFATDHNEYLGVSALLLAPFALLTAVVLARISGWRALLWAAAPALVLYSFHNWDVLVVAAVAGALWFWHRGQSLWAAVCAGIGAAVKLYPLMFVAPLALERLVERDKRGAIRVVGAGVGTFVLLNLPFALANLDGWSATYAFHRLRGPNWDTIWMMGIPRMDVGTLNLLSTTLVVASLGIALVSGWRIARAHGAYPFLQVCAAMVAGVLLWSKVHSPQYALWILPFFVVLGVPLAWWVAYSAADVLVYVGVFRWFYEFGFTGDVDKLTVPKALLYAGVWSRAALLLVLFFVFLRSRSVLAEARATVPSHPSSRLDVVGDGEPVRG